MLIFYKTKRVIARAKRTPYYSLISAFIAVNVEYNMRVAVCP